jgi:DNA polymerase I
MKKKLYLIDGSGFIFRAFHALPQLSTKEGTPVGAVLGFVNILLKFQEENDGHFIAVIFDAGRKTFRNDLYVDYKAHRPPAPPELIPQFKIVREATDAFNIPWIELEGYEADDVIATYAHQAAASDYEVFIVSSDKDLMQLVNDDNIRMLDPLKNKLIGSVEVQEKFGVLPSQVIDVLALAGDTSDNVPGVPRIGLKTAATLIQTYGNLENVLAEAKNITKPALRQNLIDYAEDARLSYKLVTLCDQAPMPRLLSDFLYKPLDYEKLIAFLEKYNFQSVINRLKRRQENHLKKDEPKKHSFHLIQEETLLKQVIEQAWHKGYVAIDVETTALNPHVADLVGISLCVNDDKAYYIPLAHKDTASLALEHNENTKLANQLTLETVQRHLGPLLKDSAVLKIGHNIKYDLHVLKRFGFEFSSFEEESVTLPVIEPKPSKAPSLFDMEEEIPPKSTTQKLGDKSSIEAIADTIVMSYVLDGASHGHSLDELSSRVFDYQTIRYEDVTKVGKKQITFDDVPLDKACDYAAEDALMTYKLYEVFKERITGERMQGLYYGIEQPLVAVLQKMEEKGFLLDKNLLQGLSSDFEMRMHTLQKDIHHLAGCEFNLASPKQMGEVLFNQLNLPKTTKTKTGGYSTDVDALEPLAAQGYDIAQKILDWRGLAKLKSTYADALVGSIHPKTGRVHTSFAQTLTSTGRLSSSNPNLQNIPIRTEDGKRIRSAFIARPGYKIVSFDYSQIELRLLAHIANVPSLKQAFVNKMDIHRLTASEIFGVPLDKVTDDFRRQAKTINFSIIYGISGFGLSGQLGCSVGEANTFIQTYLAKYPEIQSYMEKAKDACRKQGYVETLMGRKCYVPEIQDKNASRRQFGERAAVNAPIQGSNADIIKMAMIQIDWLLQTHDVSIDMILQVHDELVFEMKEETLNIWGPRIQKIMQNVVMLSVPLSVDYGIGQSWSEAH